MDVAKFFPLNSSDDSSDDESDNRHPILALNNDEDIDLAPSVSVETVQPSEKLNIVPQTSKCLNKKFSIWSEVLLEEELCESMGNSVNLKKRKARKKKLKEKDSDNYCFWTKEDFERKFAGKKTTTVKRSMKLVKKNLASEIGKKLKENRVDIIERIIKFLGEERSRKLTTEVINIEASGGLMTNNNTRRRSPGGVLFFLVKNEPSLTNEQKQEIFSNKFIRQPNERSGGGNKSKVAKPNRNKNKQKKNKNKQKKNKKKKKK